MPTPDYSTWLTKQQAADAIGVSTKHVERLANEKQLQHARWKRPEGGAWFSVYHPEDVARIASQRNPGAAFVMPDGDTAAKQATTAIATRQPAPEQFMQALVAAVSGMSRTSQNGVRTSERLFLTIPEAADFSGLPQSYLRALMKEEKLPALKTGGGWRIRQADLKKL